MRHASCSHDCRTVTIVVCAIAEVVKAPAAQLRLLWQARPWAPGITTTALNILLGTAFVLQAITCLALPPACNMPIDSKPVVNHS
jgi:hypothetical protein